MPFTVRSLFSFLIAIVVSNTVLAKSSNGSSSASGATSNVSVNTTTNSTVSPSQKAKDEPMTSGSFTVSRSTSLYDYKDGSRKDFMDYEGQLNIKLSEKYSIFFVGGYSQDLKDPEANDFTDTAVSVSRAKSKVGKTLMIGYGIGSVLPTSKDTNKNKGLLGSLGATLNLGINPDRLIKGLSISGAAGLSRNFHEYETGKDGRVNTQYSSKQTFSLGYAFDSGFSLSGLFIHRNTWSYQNVMRDTFEAYEEVGYQFNPTVAVSVGHTNSGSSLKLNGTDSNVQLVDENESLVYVSTTLMF